jgi:conjugal transfer pilus assembly protein TraW
MPEEDLLGALRAAADAKAIVYLRGIRPGRTIKDAVLRIQQLANSVRPAPEILIDPGAFSTYSVKAVPALVVAESPTRFTKVYGTYSVRYAKTRFDASSFGDLGARGTTFDIAEPDFIEEIKSRVAAIDWEAQKRAAIGRAWQTIEISSLPSAEKSSRRIFDPSIVLANSVSLPDGRVIAQAGAKFNPLSAFGLSRAFVFFDPTAPGQLRFAKRFAEDETAAGHTPLLIASSIDRDRGAAAFAEYSAFLAPYRLFFLDGAVKSRFGITAVPSTAVVEGDHFIIAEYGPEDLK